MEERKLQIAVPETGCNTVNYFEALRCLGAEPVSVAADVEVGAFDGLLLPGGGDLHPRLYGAQVEGSVRIDEELDARQMAVLDQFVKAGKVILGICRGHQLVNVYFGGSLIQNIPTSSRHVPHSGIDSVHTVSTPQDCWLTHLYGAREIAVNSAHHQAVDRIGRGLYVVQWSDDGVPEAMVHESLPIWTVQWHPERMCFSHAREDTVDGSIVIRAFLKQCAARRNKEEKPE